MTFVGRTSKQNRQLRMKMLDFSKTQPTNLLRTIIRAVSYDSFAGAF